MAVANHEGSKIEFAQGDADIAPVVGQHIHDFAFQSATITARTNTETVPAIGFRGVAAITDLIGTVELALDGILTYEGAGANYPNKGAAGLLDTDLYSLVSLFGNIVIDTRGEDTLDVGQKCTMSGMYVTGVSFTFNQNASATSTWNFVGYDCEWEDSDFDFTADMTVGTGINFTPLASKDVELSITAPTGDASGVQSVNFNATINRTEVYQLGTLAPIDRPVTFPFEVTASIEMLADTASLVRNVTPNYTWNNSATPAIPNSFLIAVDHKDNPAGQRIVGAPLMRPVDGTLTVSVGNNSTVTISFTGWNLEF